ncbi:MAG: DNA-processing protein DprA [Candidatus Margulisiibacteriota bacterium]
MQDDRSYWPALAKLPLGAVKLKRALKKFGSPKAVWEAPARDFLAIDKVGEQTVAQITDARKTIDPENELKKMQKAGVSMITLYDHGYPELLKQIYDPPVILFYKGCHPERADRTIAIVGTRKAGIYGAAWAKKLAGQLTQAGFTIVSGMALGIDTCAHKGALATGGCTWAVLGSGFDRVYPTANKKLFEEICETGTVFSELPLGMPYCSGNFPARNRIITGLSLGTVIVQCARKSGAMISASCALEQNREVFAVPGNIDNVLSEGPNLLIKQGARLVEKVEDILEEFSFSYPQKTERLAIELSGDEELLYLQLSSEPQGFDILAARCQLPMSKLTELLLALEFKDAIRQLPGKYYVVK